MTNQTAFVFPGQGSQSIGMLTKLISSYSDILEPLFSKASQILKYDIKTLIEKGPKEHLDQTINTQPVMLVADLAYWIVSKHVKPDQIVSVMAGHSVGEYAALVAADVLELDDVCMLISERARLMQEAVPRGMGAMGVIIGATEDQVRAVCDEVVAGGSFVAPANFNAPNQIVIAGYSDAVNLAFEKIKAIGAKKVLKLPMSIPSHCELMRPMMQEYQKQILKVKMNTPKIPVIQNADNIAHENTDKIRTALINQLCLPVRWVDTIHIIKSMGICEIIECGPGKVLTGLNKRIEPSISCVALSESL